MQNNILQKKAWLSVLLSLLLAVFLAVGNASSTSAQAAGEEKEESLAFTQQATVMRVGQTKIFATNRENASWKSSNPKVAVVSSKGKVRAIGIGQTKILAMADGSKISISLEVKRTYTVGIDPGHQLRMNADVEPIGPGSSTTKTKVSAGTSGVSTKKPEYALTLEVSTKLAAELRDRGYKVVMSHDIADVDMGNVDRAEKLNKDCDAVLRIHADGAVSSAHGASALYPSRSNPYVGNISAACENLSRKVLDEYCAATGLTNRGLFLRDDLTGTNWSKVPVTLIEMGFMTNVFDDEFMASDEGQKRMVEGLANGVDKYFE